MLKRIGVVVVWMLATLGTASLTYAAVSQVGLSVADSPTVPVAASDIAARVSTTTAGATTTTTDGVTPSSVTTTTTVPGTSPSTTVITTTTTTMAAATTTTTTAAAPHTEWKSVPGVGTVGVSVSGSSVSLVSAQPVAPYDADIEDNGPDRVEVKFEKEDTEYRVRAEVRDGTLEWEVTVDEDDSGG